MKEIKEEKIKKNINTKSNINNKNNKNNKNDKKRKLNKNHEPNIYDKDFDFRNFVLKRKKEDPNLKEILAPEFNIFKTLFFKELDTNLVILLIFLSAAMLIQRYIPFFYTYPSLASIILFILYIVFMYMKTREEKRKFDSTIYLLYENKIIEESHYNGYNKREIHFDNLYDIKQVDDNINKLFGDITVTYLHYEDKPLKRQYIKIENVANTQENINLILTSMNPKYLEQIMENSKQEKDDRFTIDDVKDMTNSIKDIFSKDGNKKNKKK